MKPPTTAPAIPVRTVVIVNIGSMLGVMECVLGVPKLAVCLDCGVTQFGLPETKDEYARNGAVEQWLRPIDCPFYK
jgi:hypothetical protein